jgi:hypothetical protein
MKKAMYEAQEKILAGMDSLYREMHGVSKSLIELELRGDPREEISKSQRRILESIVELKLAVEEQIRRQNDT